ncbi:hypothetical protein R3P38DRAFT_2888227 [Favolaschia claudopus]|uniref:Uncharacterized protein n=1 Tax=Favolaschia claudopus TaxID=2862362 RepID=A0AAW0CRX9_9AGAR
MSGTNTNSQNKSSSSASIGTKFKGGVQVAKGLGDTVQGTTLAAMNSIEHGDPSLHEEQIRRGRTEIENGIAMIKGHPAAATNNNPSLQGWGSGINGANPNATTNATGFPAPGGKEYAQNSTTANAANSDLGRGPNAYSGNADQPPYSTPGGPTTGGMGNTHPTQMGGRPTTGAMVGEQDYQQRQDADQAL